MSRIKHHVNRIRDSFTGSQGKNSDALQSTAQILWRIFEVALCIIFTNSSFVRVNIGLPKFCPYNQLH